MSLILFIVCRYFLRYLKILFFFETSVSWLNTILCLYLYLTLCLIGFNINISVFTWQILIMFFSSIHILFFCFIYVTTQKDITLTKLSLQYQRILSFCLFTRMLALLGKEHLSSAFFFFFSTTASFFTFESIYKLPFPYLLK